MNKKQKIIFIIGFCGITAVALYLVFFRKSFSTHGYRQNDYQSEIARRRSEEEQRLLEEVRRKNKVREIPKQEHEKKIRLIRRDNGWTIYRDEQYNFEIQYPPNWLYEDRFYAFTDVSGTVALPIFFDSPTGKLGDLGLDAKVTMDLYVINMADEARMYGITENFTSFYDWFDKMQKRKSNSGYQHISNVSRTTIDGHEAIIEVQESSQPPRDSDATPQIVKLALVNIDGRRVLSVSVRAPFPKGKGREKIFDFIISTFHFIGNEWPQD